MIQVVAFLALPLVSVLLAALARLEAAVEQDLRGSGRRREPLWGVDRLPVARVTAVDDGTAVPATAAPTTEAESGEGELDPVVSRPAPGVQVIDLREPAVAQGVPAV